MTDRALCVVFVGLSVLTVYVEGTLRLIGGDDQYEGRLEIYNNGEWQSICDDIWSNDNTIVACRQLGLKGGSERDVTSLERGDGTFWLTQLECDGDEPRLETCNSKDSMTTVYCRHKDNDDVYVTCKPPKDDVLRLRGGSIQNEGRLEIYHEEEWGTVCEDKWDDYPQNAQVACRQLGFEGGSFRTVSFSERDSGTTVWMDDVKCLGLETHIQDCPFRGWGHENCYYGDAIYLECDEHKDNLTRLVDGSDQYEGRLEVYHAGQWSTVCIHHWDRFVLNAHVACRQLGHTGGSFRPVTVTEQGEGHWMDDIECNGDEVNLYDCNSTGWGNANCSHSANDELFLQCNPNKGAVKLADGNNRYNGRVQVFNDGKWITLCDDRWTDTNLKVICRQLGTIGKESSNEVFTKGYYYPGDFQCSDDDEYLMKCSYRNRDCRSNEKRVVASCVIPASPRNGRCDIDIQETCNTTLTCQDVNGFGRCICDNESFWDDTTNTCRNKMMYNEVCDPIVDDVCTSDLSCKRVNGSTQVLYKCVCPEENYFWDISIKACRAKIVYNEVCDPIVDDVCTSDLSCKRVNGSTQVLYKCVCPEENYFWDISIKACREKIVYNEVCDPIVDDVCTSDLSCERKNGPTQVLYKCLCPEENDFWDISNNACRKKKLYAEECDPTVADICRSDLSCESINGTSSYVCKCPEENEFWDSSYKECRSRTSLRGIYVADKLNITEGISNCENNYNSQLATEEHLQHVLSNCMGHADDIWLIGILYSTSESLSKSCAILNQYGELKTANCTGRKASVCITKKNNQSDLLCVGFPTAPNKSFQGDSTTSSAGLIGGIVAVVIILAVVVMLGLGLLYRRRNEKCKKDEDGVDNHAYGLSDTATVGAFKLETGPADNYDYAMETPNRKAQAGNHSNVYANDQDASDDVTENQYEVAGEIDQVYSFSKETPDYANYREDHSPPNDVTQAYSLKNSSSSHGDPPPNTDDLPEDEYNTFADVPADLPPSDTYDHMHDVPEDGYDQFQLRSSERSNFTQDEETGYMQSTFPG